MTVLVTAASKHGATSEIAARIGAGLAERGVEVEVKKPEEVYELDQYEAFVVESGPLHGEMAQGSAELRRRQCG
jgi:menaquinone-dependent protoporphyrinogen oxidase